jgi:hypothetical protein
MSACFRELLEEKHLYQAYRLDMVGFTLVQDNSLKKMPSQRMLA